jgi:hypothetical protein
MTAVNPDNQEARRQELPAEEVAKRLQAIMPQETSSSERTFKVHLTDEELEKMAETALFGPKPSDT